VRDSESDGEQRAVDDRVVEGARRPLARRGLGRGLGAILPANGLPHTDSGPGGHRLAAEDPLTGLAQRPRLLERLDHALAQARQDGVAVAILVFGLDGFRHVNAAFGHDAGDRVLRDLGDRLSRSRRAADTVARLGGDEFAVVCPRVDGARAAGRVAARLAEEIERPIVVDGIEYRLGATIGIAVTPRGGGPWPARTLLGHADLAMHRAKDDGLRWSVFAPG
jgi:diguanylate cyclase (GGDEF)-like protein